MLTHLGQIQPIKDEQLSKLSEVLKDLNNEQKIWLSGYLAGQSTLADNQSLNHQPVAAKKPSPESRLTVLYGSQTGNARFIAENLYQTATADGYQVELISLADFKPRQITKTHNLALLVSTHGEGDAPDDAEIFYEYIFSSQAPQLGHLNFTVLALGDSSYEKFCQTGIDFDQRFEQLSANRIQPRQDCDLDFESDALQWQQDTIDWFKTQIKPLDDDVSNVIPISPATGLRRHNRAEPYSAEVLTLQPLTTDESSKVIFHVELSIEDSGIEYQPGDALGVYAPNRPEDVKTVIEHLGIEPKAEVNYKGEQRPIAQLLTEDLEISLLNKKLLDFCAQRNADGALLQQINDHEKRMKFLKNHQLIDVIQQYKLSINAQELVDHLAQITPRMYSIASSQNTHPDEVHLTVALVRANDHRHGLISGAFCKHLSVGDKVKVYVESNQNFKLPDDPTTATIMIGPGTGVAPFRSFLQDRQSIEDSGTNWLFFGNPHFDHDFIYQLEWQKFIDEGVLNQMDVAFSRDQTHKIYVQDLIWQKSAEIWGWLQSGAHLYICGDKERMTVDVEKTLLKLLQQHGKLTADQAKSYLLDLKRQNRYQKDVY